MNRIVIEKRGFYSSLLHFRRWKKLPTWMRVNGEIVEVCIVFGPPYYTNPKFNWENFKKRQFLHYPDIIWYDDLITVVDSGIQKPKFRFSNSN